MNLKVSDPEVAGIANTIVESSAELSDIADAYARTIADLGATGIRSARFVAASAHLGPSVRAATMRLAATISPIVALTNNYIDELDAADADFDLET